MHLKRPTASLVTALVLSLTGACSPADPVDSVDPGAPSAEGTPTAASLAPRPAPQQKSAARAKGAQEPPIPADTEIQTHKSGLVYSILKPSEGELLPKRGDRVRAHFTGWLVDGTVFENTRDKEPVWIEVGETLGGLNKGLTLMGVGSRFKFTLPPKLGYGAAGRPPLIPSNATLIFDVELLELVPMPVFRPASGEQELTESGIRYSVIRPGEGDALQPNDAVTVRYALWNISGQLLDCSERNGDHRLKSKVSKLGDMKLPFLKEAIGLMRAGAHYRFEVPPKYAFGSNPPPGIGPKSIAVWELELERVLKPLPRPDFAQFDESLLEKLPSGLELAIIEQGDGPKPGLKSRVKAHYIGWLVDGKVFDSSYDLGEPATMVVGELITGLSLGLRKMKAGSTFMFRIPPGMAYGGSGEPPYIGPFATLIFRVELISVDE